MAQSIQYGSTFNPATTFVPDIYNEVIPPQAYYGGIPTSIAFIRGTASWGGFDSPILCSADSQAFANFGNLAPAAVTDPHDLLTDAVLCFSQAPSGNGVAAYLSRAGDGTQTKASVVLYDTSGSPQAYGTPTARFAGQEGNNLRMIITDGQAGLAAAVQLAGTLTTGNKVNITFFNQLLPSGKYTLQYTVQSGDTTIALLAQHIAAAINADPNLQQPQITATYTSTTVQIVWPQIIGSVSLLTSVNGSTTVTIGGTVTTSDIVRIVINDPALTMGGTQTIAYTTVGGDTTTTIATALKNAINANSALNNAGITATSSSAVITVVSNSKSQTTLDTNKSAGATETLTVAAGPTETTTIVPTSTLTVRVVPFKGGGQVELYTGLPNTGASFGPALQAALTNGQGPSRPPSKFLTMTDGVATTNGPNKGTFVLSGGTDGREVNTAQLIGNSSGTGSGIYQAAGMQFYPSVMWVAGLVDPEAWPNIQAFADNYFIFTLFAFDAGMSSEDAIAQKNLYGMQDFQIGFLKDWTYIFDNFNQVHRLVAPYGIMGGAIVALPPWESPFNKTVKGLQGTERTNPYTGSTPYLDAEIAELTQAGIMFLTNDGPGGNSWRFRNGCNSIGNNDVASPVEYARMINFIVGSQDGIEKRYLGKLQGSKPNDSTRSQIAASLNSFYEPLNVAEYIDGYEVACDLRNNSTGPQGTIARHIAITSQKVRFMSSILYIFNNIQGGTTVELNGKVLGSIGGNSNVNG